MLAGHTDTVPYNEQYWRQDPLKLTVANDRAYGLGATDMKGFFPTILAAIEFFIGKALEQRGYSALIKTVEVLTGQQPENVAFATEAPFLQNMGIDVVVMGPGSIDSVH